MSPREIVIYTRRDCSLCERMEVGARELLGPEVRVELVEIDDDPALLARFGRDVPVLCVDDEVVCKHLLDAGRLQAAVRSGQDGRRPAPV